MKVGSLFAGVGGFDIAAERAGMDVVWQSEVDPHASRVLEHHWPGRNLGDIHNIRIGLDPDGGYARAGTVTNTTDRFNSRYSVTASDHTHGGTDDRITAPAVDVLCGGFPCQDYSVAGNREGLAGDRGALWWEFHRLIAEGRPEWVVGENVPGLLSSRGGRDFATIVDSLVELGYGVAWGVLDAQYFGVAQRRRRVFLVGHSGGRPRPEVLALSEGLFGHPAPSREKGERPAPTLAERTRGGGGLGTDTELDGGLIPSAVGWAEPHRNRNPEVTGDVSITVPSRAGTGGNNGPMVMVSSSGQDITGTVTTTWAKGPGNTQVEEGALVAFHATQEPINGPVAPRLGANAAVGVAFAQNQRDELRDLNNVAGALAAEPGMKQQTYVTAPQVRRLTPLECERLQGFPDGWTDVAGMSDSQRYKQMGNAVAVPVVGWIMGRVASAHALDNGGVG